MSARLQHTLLRLSWLGIFVVGCQAAEEAPEADVPTTPPIQAVVNPPDESEGPEEPIDSAPAERAPEPAPQANTPTERTAPNPTEQAAADEYVAPFPNRVDLFVPPRRSKVANRDDDGYNESVELKGFVSSPKLDGDHVLLAIDGVESPIAAGEEKYGVQVISISRPSVVLQRGRTRWTETLD